MSFAKTDTISFGSNPHETSFDILEELLENPAKYKSEDGESVTFSIYGFPTSLWFALDETCIKVEKLEDNKSGIKPSRNSAMVCCLTIGLSYWARYEPIKDLARQRRSMDELSMLRDDDVSELEEDPKARFVQQFVRDLYDGTFSFNVMDNMMSKVRKQVNVTVAKELKQGLEKLAGKLGISLSTLSKICMTLALFESQKVSNTPWLAKGRVNDLEATIDGFAVVAEVRKHVFGALITVMEKIRGKSE